MNVKSQEVLQVLYSFPIVSVKEENYPSLVVNARNISEETLHLSVRVHNKKPTCISNIHQSEASPKKLYLVEKRLGALLCSYM